MFETLKRLYQTGTLTQAQLSAAVKKGWITGTQAKEIQQMK